METIRFARHRGEKRHRQPEEELRILALDANAPGMAIDFFDAGQRIGVEIEPFVRRHFPGCLVQCFAQFLEADDSLGHHAEDRRVQARMGEALHLVNVVVGCQLPTAGLGEIGESLTSVSDIFAQIQRLTVSIAGKGRMGLKADVRLQLQFINALGNLIDRRIGRQFTTLLIVKAGNRHLLQR